MQQRLVEAGRLTGQTIAIDATTLEANAAMRSIVRRDTGESYQAFLAGLATASGMLDRQAEEEAQTRPCTPHASGAQSRAESVATDVGDTTTIIETAIAATELEDAQANVRSQS